MDSGLGIFRFLPISYGISCYALRERDYALRCRVSFVGVVQTLYDMEHIRANRVVLVYFLLGCTLIRAPALGNRT